MTRTTNDLPLQPKGLFQIGISFLAWPSARVEIQAYRRDAVSHKKRRDAPRLRHPARGPTNPRRLNSNLQYVVLCFFTPTKTSRTIPLRNEKRIHTHVTCMGASAGLLEDTEGPQVRKCVQEQLMRDVPWFTPFGSVSGHNHIAP